MRALRDEHRPPKDLFGPGFLIGSVVAAIGYLTLFGTKATAANAANARIAALYESCAPGTPSAKLIDRLGEPTNIAPFGNYELLRFRSPLGFGFEIDAVVRAGKVSRIFTLESERHREALDVQLARLRR